MTLYFKRASDGAWLDTVVYKPSQAKEFYEKEATAERGYTVVAVEAHDDPRSGAIVSVPHPADTDYDAIAAILVKADADVTAAELKAVVLRSLRRMHRKGWLR